MLDHRGITTAIPRRLLQLLASPWLIVLVSAANLAIMYYIGAWFLRSYSGPGPTWEEIVDVGRLMLLLAAGGWLIVLRPAAQMLLREDSPRLPEMFVRRNLRNLSFLNAGVWVIVTISLRLLWIVNDVLFDGRLIVPYVRDWYEAASWLIASATLLLCAVAYRRVLVAHMTARND